MPQNSLPSRYQTIKTKHPAFIDALETLGKNAKQAGPLSEKQAQLIQLAAAASIKSEGAVHSHARQARESGASQEEVYHSLLLLTSTIGFPSVAAALSWVDDLDNM